MRCYAYELAEYLGECLKNKSISHDSFKNLCAYIIRAQKTKTIEELSKIERHGEGMLELPDMPLKIVREIKPAFLYLEKPHYSVECIVQHRQRAIGYQVMVYLCLPLMECLEYENIRGRPAEQKEKVHYQLDENLLLDCFKIFALNSPAHYQDIYALCAHIAKEIKLDFSFPA